LATKRLNELGYKNAVLMKDGLSVWKKADYPVDSGGGWLPF
jgi:rhodanese-related sulfurtransferase